MTTYRSVTSDIYVESLTRREVDVLTLLAENLSDNEIANRLTLALSSVKWYTRQVYQKMEVENRRQAVAKARELGWLSAGKAAARPIHNLPRQMTRLIGRVKEISQVIDLVHEHPLVTLTGSGGVGKTRLALAAANELFDDFPDGIRYIELATLTDPQSTLREVMSVIGLHEEAGRTLLETLVYYFRDCQALLILDNAEHLIDASAELANTLLHSAHGLKILATSREPLGVRGEAVYRVPSLPFPTPGPDLPMEDLLQFGAVQLFIDRAKDVLPDFLVNPQNLNQVAKICKRLDGIPLAIELAASRVASLDVEQIAVRLERDFRMLSGNSRVALERQRTLRAAIDWSYNLLTDAEQHLLRRLGIFTGGWTLAAAEKICKGDGIAAEDVVDMLSRLVNKSMVLAEITPGKQTRYRMLETIHQYVFEELYRSGESEELRRRHCAWFVEFANSVEELLSKSQDHGWIKKLKADHDNLRAALAWSLDEGADPKAGLILLNSLISIDGWGWDLVQSFHWLEKGLAAVTSANQLTPILHIKTLTSMAETCEPVDWRMKIPLLEKGISLCEELGAMGRLVRAKLLDKLGWHLAFDLGQLDEGMRAYAEAETILRELGTEGSFELSFNLIAKSWVFKVQGNYAEQEACVEESWEISQEHGEVSFAYAAKGDIALQKGNYSLANQIYEANLQSLREVEDELLIADRTRKLGDVAKAQVLYEKAAVYYGESLSSYYNLGHLEDINWLLACLGILQTRIAQNQDLKDAKSSLLRASRIFGAAQTVAEELGLPLPVHAEIIKEYEQAVIDLREKLKQETFEEAWTEGRAMKLKQAVNYAMG